MANANDYNRIMRKAWADVPNEAIFNVWPNRAATACRAIFKMHKGRKLFLPIKFTSGNRDTWVHRDKKTKKVTLYINPDQGWIEINHLFSHWIARRKGLGAHSDQHLELERAGAELIVQRGLPTVDPLPVKEEPKIDLVAQRAAGVDTRIEKWEKKLKRAEIALKKLRVKQRYYAKRQVA